jgi:Fic family protein
MQEPKIRLSQAVLKLVAELDEFKGRWLALGKLEPQRLESLKKVATIESVGSSTRIEGVTLSDEEVERLLSGLKPRSFKTRDEEEVVGYAEAMKLVFESFDEIPLTENHIKQIHQRMLQYSSKDQRHRGEYKKLPNDVQAFDTEGKSLGIVFKTATPFETPLRMRELLDWTIRSLESESWHPLLVIAVFVVCFLAIHPFQDGNGRLSRILTHLLLLRCGYLYVPYASIERIIELNKKDYYISLRRAQGGMEKDGSGLEPWVLFFLETLKAQKDVLVRKVVMEREMESLSELSIHILGLVKEHGRMSNRQLLKTTGANRNTLKLHLKKLVAAKRLRTIGKGRGVVYVFWSGE